MGVVYRARHQGAGRDVALKVLPQQRLSAEAAERFRREGEATAAIQHPNVVRIHDAGQWGEVLYLAYELVEGGRDLSDRVGRVSPEEAAALVAQVADGVGAAHALGIVHRDLKPANVLLDREGRPKVADFGVARGEGSEALTKTGGIVGTPYYMAPECLQGEKATAASDVWSLGVILYELVTGELPFQAATFPGLVGAVVDRAPPRLTFGGGAAPAWLEGACLRALTKDPAGRQRSAVELARELRERSGAERRGARWWWVVGGLTVSGALVGGVVGVSLRGEPSAPRSAAPTAAPDPEAQVRAWLAADPQRAAEVLASSSGVGIDLRVEVALAVGDEGVLKRCVEAPELGAEWRGRALLRLGRGALKRGRVLRAGWWFGQAGATEGEERDAAAREVLAEWRRASVWSEVGAGGALEELRGELDVVWAGRALGLREDWVEGRQELWERAVLRTPLGREDPEWIDLSGRVVELTGSPTAYLCFLQAVGGGARWLREELPRVFEGRGAEWPPERLAQLDPDVLLRRLRSGIAGESWLSTRRPAELQIAELLWAWGTQAVFEGRRAAWEEALRELATAGEARYLPDAVEGGRSHVGRLWEYVGYDALFKRREGEALAAFRRAVELESDREVSMFDPLTLLLYRRALVGDTSAEEECRRLAWDFLERGPDVPLGLQWGASAILERGGHLLVKAGRCPEALDLFEEGYRREVRDVRTPLRALAWGAAAGGVRCARSLEIALSFTRWAERDPDHAEAQKLTLDDVLVLEEALGELGRLCEANDWVEVRRAAETLLLELSAQRELTASTGSRP